MRARPTKAVSSSMKPRNPSIRSPLAGKYVIDTFTVTARRRVERLLEHELSIVGEVETWQSQLYQFVELLPERTPPVGVWRNLLPESSPTSPAPVASGTVCCSGGQAPYWRAPLLSFGPSLSGWSGNTSCHVVVTDQERQTGWLVNTEIEHKTLEVRALADQSSECRTKLRVMADHRR